MRLKAGFRPDQPRAPAGNPDGGRWTDEFVLFVGRRARGSPPVRVGNRWLAATPAQEARLAVSHGEMRAALRAVRKVDPKWRPVPQIYESVEGEIAANEAIALQAHFRLFELSQRPFGPGPFAREWMPAPSTNRRLTKREQAEIDRLGGLFGCHRCGTKKPGTASGHFVGDHQMPKSIGKPSRLYPHCIFCSSVQGGLLKPRGGR